MKKPRNTDKEAINKVLKGDYGEIVNMFDWSDSELGTAFWNNAYEGRTLPPKGRTYLRKLLGIYSLKSLLEETE